MEDGMIVSAAPRLMIAGAGSGCGKTTLTCALLESLKRRGYSIAAFKCGPDYIDPMFHSQIIGAPSANIDLFFVDEPRARALFARHAGPLNLIEGVMGYYDGTGMDSDAGSSYRVARALDAPVVLVVNARGMALSTAALVKGFERFRAPSGIRGVIFNHVSQAMYPLLRSAVEKETGIRAYGYMPENALCSLESRHLGLVTAQEVENLREKMRLLAEQAERSVDIDGLIELMNAAPPIRARDIPARRLGEARVAVARDRAFCFYYRDNLELLERLGATLVPFSPLEDERLPECDGLLLGGGYPELYAKRLEENRAMLGSIRAAVSGGLPTIAECGGFMLLAQCIGNAQMAGAIKARCFETDRLVRFGYAAFTARRDCLILRAGESVRGHEFHYYDADAPGDGLEARKPSGRAWRCGWVSDTLYAGYPHLYFYSNPRVAERFVEKCLEGKKRHEANGD